ncbi:MAG: tail fiber protein [Bacteroidetes bacterium]|nr:tail fiber protein [Bacteroidota bacterium]MBU1721056.1 tail fiber protein [Bacteroidota bacterium]
MSVPYAAVSGETLQPVPAGTVVAYFGTTPPSGWLLCDGTAISRTTYANLYAAIGSFCGSGDGSTTFNLPDLRGVFLRGVNGTRSDTIADPDKDNRVASKSGGNTGNNVGSLQNDAFQGHWHSYYTNYTSLTTEGGANRVDEISTSNIGFTPVGRLGQPISDGTSGTPRTTSETRPKNVYVYYIIKY